MVEAPAVLCDAEQQEDQRAERQQEIADEKILTVENAASSDDGQITPYVEAEHAGDAAEQNDREVHKNRFLPAPAEIINGSGNQILKYSGHCGEACKRHEDKEQSSPKPSSCHIQEYLRQRDENQRGSLIGAYIIREACRENNQSRHQSDKGIQHTDPDGFAGKRILA